MGPAGANLPEQWRAQSPLDWPPRQAAEALGEFDGRIDTVAKEAPCQSGNGNQGDVVLDMAAHLARQHRTGPDDAPILEVMDQEPGRTFMPVGGRHHADAFYVLVGGRA